MNGNFFLSVLYNQTLKTLFWQQTCKDAVVLWVCTCFDCLSLTPPLTSSQASHCPQPFQPSTSCFSSACARGGPATFPSVTLVSMHCAWWWASSLLVTWFACTCTRVCWPRPCFPPTVCGPGKTALWNHWTFDSKWLHWCFSPRTGLHLVKRFLNLMHNCIDFA